MISDASNASLDINLRSSWSTGFVVDLALLARQSLNGWTIEFEFDGDITNIWNARIVSQIGNRYLIESLGYNGTLDEGGSASFGFQGAGDASTILPIAINDEPFEDAEAEPQPEPDPTPTLTIADASAGEGDGEIAFAVTMSEISAQDVTIAYQTVAGSATSSDDYVEADSQLVIPAGQISAEISVALTDDAVVEATERFELRLLSADGAEIADGTATAEIIDDDVAMDPGEPQADDDADMSDAGEYQLSLDDWGAGFVARFYITPGEAVSGGWTVSIATTATIANVWNAKVVSHDNGLLILQNADWNGDIAADQTIEIGIQGAGSTTGLDLLATSLPLAGLPGVGDDPADDDPVGGDPVGGDPSDPGDDGGDPGGDSDPDPTPDVGPFVGGGRTFTVGETSVVTGFDPTRDVLDLGPNSIHNQIPVDTAGGFMMLHMFNPSLSLLVEGVRLADLHPENFAPISDSHLQQDLSAALAYEDGSGLVRPNTVYIRSHEEGLVETVDFNPATDKISFFYLSVRGDGQRNFAVEDTAEGARFFNPLTGQSLTLSGVSFSELNSAHFEWRANQLEDGIAGRMGLDAVIDDFQYVGENIFSGKSVAMAGGVDRAPYHSQPDYTGTPIGDDPDAEDPVDPDPDDPVDDDPADPGDDGGDTGGDGGDDGGDDDPGDDVGGPFVGGGLTYAVGDATVVTGFDPTRDVLDLGPSSIHNQIPVDTADGFMMMNMFNAGQSLLVEGVFLADLHPENFAPISDAHLQQDLSAALAFEDGTGLVRPNTVYIRSHEEGLVETVDFNPATDKISFFYLSVRGDGQLNFAVEDTAEGARFYSPLTGQSLTLRGVSFAELDSAHFEWRANQLEDNIAGRMGLSDVIDGFQIVSDNVFTGKSVAMAGGVDRAPYHSVQGYEDYTGTPIGGASDPDPDPDPDADGDTGDGDTPMSIGVTVTGGSVTEADPGMVHVHDDGSDHVHDDGHRFITFTVALDAPAAEEVTLTYATADGTAVADTTSDVAWDYHEATGTLVFAPGEQVQTVIVAVHPDHLVEGTESFTLRVDGENISGMLEAVGTIYDNDVEADDDADGGDGGGGPFVGGGQTYAVGDATVVTGFDPTRDVLDLGPSSIHNQIPVDTADGFMMMNMFNAGQSLLVEGVFLADLHPENFAPISDAHLQQDLSAALAFEDGTGLARPNTVYIRSHEEGLVETVDFNPATDKISFFYLSVRGDGQLNFAVEDTAEGARFYSPLTGQSLTLSGVSFAELNSDHFEWRANQLEDNIAGRMGLSDVIDGFQIISDNVFTGKSVAMAGGVDRAPYHSVQGYEDYTGTPIGDGMDHGDTGGDDDDMPGDTDHGDTGGDMPDDGDPAGHDHGDHSGDFLDITTWGTHHGTSSHTDHEDLMGGRTAITTEALIAYNGLRNFLGLADAEQGAIGDWAFANDLTNNDQGWGGDVMGVGLWYAMQGAKVGWIDDGAFDPQILADIQREARLGDPSNVMAMVDQYGHEGFAEYLTENGLADHFVNTLKMEPHYGGWMHGRTHGDLQFPDGGGAVAHDVNHLTVLSHDQTQPFMNDTFDWPQWAALDVPHQDVIDYFQSMVVLGDPLGDALPSDGAPTAPSDPPPAEPDPDTPIVDGSDALDARLIVSNDWGGGAVVNLEITNTDQFQFSDGWAVQFNFDADAITGSWNSQWSADPDGGGLTVSDVGWNGLLASGQSVVVGFQLSAGNLDEGALNTEAAFIFL